MSPRWEPLGVKEFPNTVSIKLTKLNERVRPHGAADALRLVGDDELLLQLVQEAERQHVGVVGRAHHHVADAQRAREAETRASVRGRIGFVREERRRNGSFAAY